MEAFPSESESEMIMTSSSIRGRFGGELNFELDERVRFKIGSFAIDFFGFDLIGFLSYFECVGFPSRIFGAGNCFRTIDSNTALKIDKVNQNRKQLVD